MANQLFLGLRESIRQHKFIYILIGLTILILLGYRNPEKVKAQALTHQDSAKSVYANFNGIPKQRISGLYTLWRKLTAMDTVLEKLEKPLEPIGTSNYKTLAMLESDEIKQSVEQLTDRYICLADFKSFGNLFSYDKPRLWIVDQEPKYISLDSQTNYLWLFNKKVVLRVGKNLNLFQDKTVGELELNLADFPNDTLVTFKVPIEEAGADLLIENSDRSVYATVGLHPIEVKDCMKGGKILPSAVIYPHDRIDSGYVAEKGSAGIEHDAPFKQYIIPAHKRYTALILHYNKRETTSIISVANMDSVGQLPGVRHPELPIMVAAINQRQSLAVNILSTVPGNNVDYTLVAATANRYHDLKDLYLWFVKKELGNIQHRGAPLSEANMKLVSEWINEQFGFKLTRKDSSDLARYYRLRDDNE